MKMSHMATLALGATLVLAGCTNTVKYDKVTDNKTMVQNVDTQTLERSTSAMINGMLGNSRVQAATESRRPVLAIYGLVDMTGEKVDVTAINNDLYAELNKTARFRFADAISLEQATREQNPNPYALLESPQAAQPLTRAVAADYLLIGEVSKVIRTQPNLKETFYRISLKLVDPASNHFVWEEKREFLQSQKKIVYGV